MRKIKIDDAISATLLATQVGLGYYAFVNQNEGMKGDTLGVSLGMFFAILLFNTANMILGILSWLKEKTFPTFVKIIPYSVVAVAYTIFIFNCIHSRLLHNDVLVHKDDIATLPIVLFFYGVFVSLEKQKYLSWRNVFASPITWGYFSGITVGIAHVMFAYHMLSSGSSAGISTKFIILSLISISIRLIQNFADIKLAGTDKEKKALLISEIVNVSTWIVVGVVFFLNRI